MKRGLQHGEFPKEINADRTMAILAMLGHGQDARGTKADHTGQEN
jgi:hypothetical protein